MNEETILARINDLEKQMARFEGDVKTLFTHDAQQQALLNTVNALARSVDKQMVILEQHSRDMGRLQADVTALKEKPGKRWDTLIAAAIAALVGFALARLGIQ